MKIIVAFVALSTLLVVAANAEVVSLTTAQREKLAEWVMTDKTVAAQFQPLQREAEAALKSTPNPIEKIQSEGKLSSDPARIHTRESLKDMRKIDALGWAFAVTGDARYAARAKEFLLAWARVNQASGDPIDETNLEPLITTFDLVRAHFSVVESEVVANWLKKVATAEMGSRKEKASTSYNNWNSHRLKIVGLIGFALADKALIRYAVDGYKTQVEANLHPDGSSFDFHERDALHYHCYDLEPLLVLAIAAQQNGIDLYHFQSASGASVPKSVQFLISYCDGSKTHPEWVHSKVAFDRKRAQSGDKHFEAGRLFEPKEAAPVFELAAFFDEKYEATYALVTGKAAGKYLSWPLVVAAARRVH